MYCLIGMGCTFAFLVGRIWKYVVARWPACEEWTLVAYERRNRR